MSKGKLIVAIFSVCLIALFVTLVYLMSNIDPAVRSDSIKYYDDYFFSPNEAPPSHGKLGYGLEKVTGEYDDDQSSKNIARIQSVCNKTDVKDVLPNKNQTKCTKRQKNIIELVTKPIKAVKGLRRSINEENQYEIDEESPRSLLLKIKGLDGQPRIEIKLIAEKLNSKTSRKYRSSGTKIKTESNLLSKINYLELDSDTSISDASIVVVENGTFILNIFANSIDIIRENDTVSFEPANNNRTNASGNYNSQAIKYLDFNKEKYEMFLINTSLSTGSDGVNYTVLTIKDNFNLINNDTTANISITQNTTEKLTSSLISDKDDKNFTMYNSYKPHLPWERTTGQSTVRFQYQTNAKVIEEISFNTELEEKTETTESIGTDMGEANDTDNVLSSNLVGLLIPEAKATLSIGN